MTKLKQIREARGLTRKALAENVGISIRVLEAYEQGLRSINSAAVVTVLRIARALEVDLFELLEVDPQTLEETK